ncbi:MAG: hypothetical protein ACXW3Y_14450, partial [Rhodoplanes sp.]
MPGQRGNRVRLRQNQPDQTFLVERINAVAIHPELESPRTPLVKNYPSPGNRGEQLQTELANARALARTDRKAGQAAVAAV